MESKLAELEGLREIANQEVSKLNSEIIKIKRKNLFQLYEKIMDILLKNGFKRMTYKTDKDKYFRKGNLVIFNCPHFCRKVSFQEATDTGLENIFEIQVPWSNTDDIEPVHAERMYNFIVSSALNFKL